MHNERRNRIRICIAAYAYEFKGRSILTQFDFDELCDRIHPDVDTGNLEIDQFFKTKYLPYQTSWIHWYPELDEIEKFYSSLYKISGD